MFLFVIDVSFLSAYISTPRQLSGVFISVVGLDICLLDDGKSVIAMLLWVNKTCNELVR